jgi:hypothetical protein
MEGNQNQESCSGCSMMTTDVSAATTIQAFFRASHQIRKADPKARNLRTAHLLRVRLAKAWSSLELILALLLEIAKACENIDDNLTAGLELRRTWLCMREAASTALPELLACIQWCDRVVPPTHADAVRFLVPVSPPKLLGPAIEGSLVPAIAGVYLRSVPLQALMTTSWLCASVPPFLLCFDVLSDWRFSFFSLLALPGVLCVTASLNPATVNKLLRTFQTLLVGGATLLMFVVFCFMWRNHPGKILSIALPLPQFLVGMFIDAYPEAGRPLTSRIFFGLNLVVVGLLQVRCMLPCCMLRRTLYDICCAACCMLHALHATWSVVRWESCSTR